MPRVPNVLGVLKLYFNFKYSKYSKLEVRKALLSSFDSKQDRNPSSMESLSTPRLRTFFLNRDGL